MTIMRIAATMATMTIHDEFIVISLGSESALLDSSEIRIGV
jgi:hypothetical protein